MTIDQFGKALVASGLMTAEDVKAFWAAIPADGRPKDGAAFGKLLVDKGLLTPFQAAEILAGRGARLMMGDYTIVSQIGAGGMGQVYKAQHRRMKRVVALKVMSNAAMQDEAAVKRFQREVHAAARLEHPNIVTAYDSGEAGSVKYLVMQFVDGGDLSDLVKKNGRLGIDQAVGYVIQAAKGLAFAHGEGVIHRDIKPANLLLDKKGIVKILDMGLARFDDGGDGLTATEQVMGTVDYMSPEQAANTKGCDGRADIYSLGCTLWYLLTGKKLYEADTLIARLMLHRDGPLPSLVKERDDAPWPLEQALHKMIAKRAADRYQTMDEVVAALAPFGGDASSVGSTSGTGTGGGQSAELASFMQSMGTGGTKTSHPSATQMKAPAAKPATSANLEATAQLSTADVGTDPKSQVLPKGTPAAKAQPQSKKKKPGNDKTKLIAAGALGGLLLLAGIIVLIRNKDGDVVAEIKVPEGGKVEVVTQANSAVASQIGIKSNAPTPVSVAAILESADYVWSTPENLGPKINGPGDQVLVSLTNDELRLYFNRKEGADGKLDGLYEAARASTTDTFGEPKIVSQGASEGFVSHDGLSLIFGHKDLGWRRRNSLDIPFAHVGNAIAQGTGSSERSATLSPDGLTLIFSSSRDQDIEKSNLYLSRRRSPSEQFGSPTKLGPAINSSGYEHKGLMLADGRTIVFLRESWRMTTSRSDGNTVSIPLPDNPFGNSSDLWIAPDGRTAYFSADRPGGLGGRDVYVTRRVPRSGATSPAIASTPAATPSFIQSLPTTVPPGVQNLPAGKWGLRFEPGQFVEAGPAPYRDTTVVTTEIWLTDESDTTLNQSVLVGGPNGFIHTSQNDSLSMYTPHSGNPEPVAMPKNQRVHIAAVNDGRGRRLYVNGKLAASSDDAGAPTSGNRDKSLPIEISNKYRFRGVIDGVRISTTARYTADFTPDQTFTADKDTFAVYRFDEGQGNVLKDSSANGYHGRINGATWVRGGASAPPPGTATPSVSATSSLTDLWSFDSADGQEYVWSTPENLGPKINTAADERWPALSGDELCLIVDDNSPGKSDLVEYRRPSTRDPWGDGVRLTGSDHEDNLCLSEDGLTLIYSSVFKLPGHQGERDLVTRRRASRDAPWGEPENLGPLVNTPQIDSWGCISPDGLALVFHSTRPHQNGDSDLWISRRADRTSPWGTPTNMGPSVLLGGLGNFPRFFRSDKTILIEQKDGEPVLAVADANGTYRIDGTARLAFKAYAPLLTADGRTMYFNSRDLPGGFGGDDFWVIRRVPKATTSSTAVPTDVVYLDDLPELEFRVWGDRGLGKHGKYRDQGKAEQTIQWRGKPVTHALWMHPTWPKDGGAFVRYQLDGKYLTFAAEAGIPATTSKDPQSPVHFRVLGDGRELWKSPPLQARGESAEVSVDVSGVKELRLETSCEENNGNCHSTWFMPRLTPLGTGTQTAAAAPRWPLEPSKPDDIVWLQGLKATLTLRSGPNAETTLKPIDAPPKNPATIVGLAIHRENEAVVTDEVLKRIATLVDLESLDCVLAKQEPKLTKNGLPQLVALGQLRHLKLGRMGTRDTDPAFLGSFPRLESLSLHFVAYPGWEPYVARMSSLKSLSLYSIDDAKFEQLTPLPQLTDIDLGGYATGRARRDAAAKLLAKLIPWARIKVRDSKHEDYAVIIEPTAPPPGAANSQQSAAPPPAIFPFDAATALKHQEAWAKHLGVPVEFTNGVGMKFRLIPPGEFQMGLGPEFTDEELLRLNRGKDDQKLRGLRTARPAHPVRITRPFYMEVEEVTAGRYRDVVGQLRPEMEQDPNKVLGNLVAWPDAIAFCNKLSEREGKRPAYRIEGAQVSPVDNADGYRLPTEAQWEYACRAGTNTLWYFGSDGGADSNEFRKRCAAPNPFGLTGLYGGANEWCWDATHGNPYRAASVDRRDDPREDVGTSRIKRGGSGNDDSGGNRGAINSFVRIGTPGVPYSPDASRYTGFGRVVLPITASARP